MRLEDFILRFEKDALAPEDAWDVIEKVLARHLVLPEWVHFYDKRMKTKNVRKAVEDSDFLGIYTDFCQFNFCNGQIMIQEKELFHEEISWEEWAHTFLKELPVEEFRYGWVLDQEYDEWQNETDPEFYELAGKKPPNLPMISNGLPYPLEQMVYDISTNPGRAVHKKAYYEVIGAKMWLGPLFWEQFGRKRKEFLQKQEWLDVKEIEKDVLEIKAQEECFRDESTARLQDRLRAALYEESGHECRSQSE